MRAASGGAAAGRRSGPPVAAALAILGVAGLAFPAAAQQAAPSHGRVIGRSGTDLVAYAANPACGPKVSVTIVGKDPKLFEGAVSPAARFFGGVRAGHGLTCPQMGRMIARGLYNERIMFSAMADRSNDWEAVILGSGIIDAAAEDRLAKQGGPSDQSQFVKNAAFLDAGEVVKLSASHPYLCLNRGPSGCEVVGQFQRRGAQLVSVNRYRAGSGATEAIVSTPTTLSGGLLCGDPAESTVSIENPRLDPSARQDMAEQIAAQFRQNGRSCTGFQGKAGGALSMAAFGPSGRKLRDSSTAVQLAGRPNLSVPQ
ncbi:hypothetical protein L6Q21_02395 [Sandaracinobacter sp. RS1-74]|uniref:hypothetical protein n=1 Tax=Sandaracinobacteroides sayramensis TaxID=2913411 RepID=UPI001ED9FD32|nr:hypothetical protein [Sandaracinobacteroides sayramensis]MCG2839832.1 hypothetical protein [Sandaracinobacteroides sayramensis]